MKSIISSVLGENTCFVFRPRFAYLTTRFLSGAMTSCVPSTGFDVQYVWIFGSKSISTCCGSPENPSLFSARLDESLTWKAHFSAASSGRMKFFSQNSVNSDRSRRNSCKYKRNLVIFNLYKRVRTYIGRIRTYI
jgi:hypothetical protein